MKYLPEMQSAMSSKGMITFHVKINHVVELLLLLLLPSILFCSGESLIP